LKISIVTATYNCVDVVLNCLSSVSNQSYPDVSHVVIDGASNDGTLELLQDQNLAVLVSEPDLGLYDALNKALKYADGGIVGVLHSDDVFADADVLSRVVNEFLKSDTDLLYGDLCYVNSANPEQIVRYWNAGEFSYSRLAQGWMAPHPTVFIRTELFQHFGGYDLRYRIAADYDWLLRMLITESLNVTYLPEVLVYMRTGGVSNRSLSNLCRKSMEDWEIIRKHQIGGVWTLLSKNLSKVSQFWAQPKN
jgi:glycosyltransferase involved in cell wall biosynthesis